MTVIGDQKETTDSNLGLGGVYERLRDHERPLAV